MCRQTAHFPSRSLREMLRAMPAAVCLRCTCKYHQMRMHAGLAILLNIAAGVVSASFLPASTYKILNAVVFKVTLPCLVVRGIGIKTDLYRSEIWRFIGAFLLLRAISLAIAAAAQLARRCASPQTESGQCTYADCTRSGAFAGTAAWYGRAVPPPTC
jgi:hypothetical protein